MIARKSALIFLNQMLGAGFGLVLLHFVTAYIDQGTVGGVQFAFAILGTLFFVTDLGIGVAHVKRVSEGMDEGDCFATFRAFKLASTGLFLLVGLAFVGFRLYVQKVPFTDLTTTAFLLVMVYYATVALRTTMLSTFDARQESARGQLVLLAETVVRSVITIGLALTLAAVRLNEGPLAGIVTIDTPLVRFLLERHEDSVYAVTWTLAGALSLLVAWQQWRASRGRVGRFRYTILRSYITYALPLFLLGVVGTLSTYVDRIFVGYFWSKEEVALLWPAQQLRQFLEAIPYAVASLLFPAFSALHARGDWESIREMTRRSIRYIGMILMPIVAFVAVFAPEIIHVFLRDTYLRGAPALSLLAVYALVIGLMRPYYSLVSGAGRSDVSARVGITMTVSNIALNFLFIPADIKSLGISLLGLKVTGAALATLVSGLIGYVMIYYYARQVSGESAHAFGEIARQAVATGVMIGALLALDLVLPLAHWYVFPVFTVVGAAVYLAALALVRGFTRADLDFYYRLASTPEMLRYLRAELLGRK